MNFLIMRQGHVEKKMEKSINEIKDELHKKGILKDKKITQKKLF
jgi:hypothetical protein